MSLEYGARDLPRVIERKLTRPLSHEILFGKLTEGGSIIAEADNDDNIKII